MQGRDVAIASGRDPNMLLAARRALESAGVLLVDENGEGVGARLRRFRVGDVVRFRPQTNLRYSFDIAALFRAITQAYRITGSGVYSPKIRGIEHGSSFL